jgi:hypothetical protein
MNQNKMKMNLFLMPEGGSMAHTQAHDLEAFCATCPSAEEVTELLQGVGFALDFSMDAVSSACAGVLPLPAQYHYRDRNGSSEVIFLAGRDADLDGVELPEHASRFWLYAGTDAGAAPWVAHVLAVKWSLPWRRLSQACQDVA